MSVEYLDTSYKFDSNMLIEPIRKASTVRQVVPIKTVLSPSDLQIDIESVTDDFKVTVDMEPYETPRSTQELAKNTYSVPVISGEITYTYDELMRINKSKLPMSQRVADLGTEFAKMEDALAWAGSTTGVKDGGALPIIENGTAVNWDVDAYATMIATATGMGAHLGTMATNLGNLKQYPLIFAFNDKAFSTMAGIESGVGANDTVLQVFDRMLKLYGGPGSGLLHVPNLGAAVTVGDDGSLTVTVEADECVALMAISPKFFEIYASPIEAREDPVSKRRGMAVKTVERWFPYVHEATAIMYDLDATP
jgi:hypothetical protein